MGHRENALAAMLAGQFPIMASARGYAGDDGETDARIRQIRDQQESALGRSQNLLDRAQREQRELTASEKQQIDDSSGYVERLDAERVKLLDTFTPGTPQARRTAPDRLPGDNYHGAGGGSPFAHSSEPLYAKMFPALANQRNGFSSLGEFAAAVARRDPRLFAAGGMSEGTGADGGWYVPGQFLAGVMDSSLRAEVIRPNALTFPVTSSPVTIPLFDSTDRTLGVAGLNPLATAEGAQMTKQKAKLKSLTLDLKKQSVFIPVTLELIDDAPDVFSRLLELYMSKAMSAKLDFLFLRGLGAGEPLGILNSPALISVSAEGSQIADTITHNNISAMAGRLAPGSWLTSRWLVSPSAIKQLYGLKQTVLNIAGNEAVGGFASTTLTVGSDGQMSLLGRPVSVSDSMSALGDLGDIILADLQSYVIAMHGGMKLAVSDHFYFDTDERAFKLTMRLDGQPLQESAITPRVGSETLSPFVTLAAR